MAHLMNTYKRLPVTFDHGKGVFLWDTEGNQYLDALAGIAVTILGHAHPAVTKAISEQAAKLLHNSNLYQIANQAKLADLLSRLTGLPQAFFCNSGAEAVETAIKLIRLYGHHKGIEFPHIVVMTGAFHGRTLAALSAGGNKKTQEGYEPLVEGFVRVPYNDIEALRKLSAQKNIAAVLVEPVQGESGVRVPNADYLSNIRKLCDENGWLLALDEVQCGMGRTGTLFAYQGKGIKPDIVTVAKGLANGVPIGCCLAIDEVANLFAPGKHGTTFGGNPLSCAAGIATLQTIESLKLWENAKKQGEVLLKGLKDKLHNHPHVKEIRGQGLMIGIELDKPCRDILLAGLEKRLLFSVTNDTVIRLLPPLIIESAEVQMIIDVLPELINQFTNSEERLYP